MLQTIDISKLLPGMYVTKVTKQKGEMTVTASGKVKSEEYIGTMKEKGVLEVEVDLEKSAHRQPGQVKDNDYKNEAGLTYNQQLEHVLKLHDQARSIKNRLIKRASKGKLTNIDEASEVTEQLVNAAFECEDAINIVTLLKEDVEYFLEHSINCAILMVVFGRSLGYKKPILHQMGIGAMLMDIGMVKLPLLLTQKNQTYNDAEQAKMQTHVDIALKLIEPIPSISDLSVEIVKQHHERLDGSGYPDGLRDEQISMFGRMAAIVDTYDSLTTSRPHRGALNPAEALLKMTQEELGLDPSLIQEFTACIGAHPIGSLVKLKSGKLAMIIKLNKKQPLTPVVMEFYDTTTRKDTVRRIDLSQTTDEIISSIDLDEVNIGIPQLLSSTLGN